MGTTRVLFWIFVSSLIDRSKLHAWKEINEVIKGRANMGTDQISPRQFMIIVILYVIGTAILVIPASVAAETKQDAWMPQILSIAIGVVLVWLYVFIYNKFLYCLTF